MKRLLKINSRNDAQCTRSGPKIDRHGNQIYEFRLKILLCLRILKDDAPRNIATLSLSLSLGGLLIYRMANPSSRDI